jgi:hypothetical protein
VLRIHFLEEAAASRVRLEADPIGAPWAMPAARRLSYFSGTSSTDAGGAFVNNHRKLMAVVALAVVDFGLFMTSGVPRYRDATSGLDNVIGNAVWFGFLIGALTLVVIGVLSLVRLRRRAGASRTLHS